MTQNAGDFVSIRLRSPRPTRREIALVASDDERPSVGADPVERDSGSNGDFAWFAILSIVGVIINIWVQTFFRLPALSALFSVRNARVRGPIVTLKAVVAGNAIFAVLKKAAVALKEFTFGAIRTTDEIGKSAQEIGVTTEVLSALKRAGELSAVTFEQIKTGVARFSSVVLDASYGLQTYTRAFHKLGINIRGQRESAATRSPGRRHRASARFLALGQRLSSTRNAEVPV